MVKKGRRLKQVSSYKNGKGVEFCLGDKVGLTPEAINTHHFDTTDKFLLRRNKARIVYLFPDVKGLVRMEPKLGDYWTWFVDDLIKA